MGTKKNDIKSEKSKETSERNKKRRGKWAHASSHTELNALKAILDENSQITIKAENERKK